MNFVTRILLLDFFLGNISINMTKLLNNLFCLSKQNDANKHCEHPYNTGF